MGTLARFAGPLALVGGAVWVIANLIQVAAPLSYAWIGLFASVLLIGGAALGLQRQFGARTGTLGRWGAAATAAGSVALLAFLLFAVAVGYVATPPPPILVLSWLSLLLWVVGSVVFAVGLMRAKAISPIAAWLIVLGAVVSPLSVIAGGQNPPPYVFLPLVIYGVGWVLLGYETRTPAADNAIAGQAS